MIFENKYVCMFALSIEILIEHAQLMSFVGESQTSSSQWNSNATSAFNGLRKIALRFYDSTFMGLYITATIIVFVTLAIYAALNQKLHDLNKSKNVPASIGIWFFEHILFGIGYVPILSQFVSVQYCGNDNNMYYYSSLQCWNSSHMATVNIGYIFSGLAMFIAGVLLPIFKSERIGGIERKFGNESYFIGTYKLLIMGVIFLFAPIQRPELGVVFTLLLAIYLGIFEAFAELHVASMYLAVLVGQIWVFSCSVQLDSNNNGSDMLIGWPIFLIAGYLILPVKSLLFKRTPKILPIEKQ